MNNAKPTTKKGRIGYSESTHEASIWEAPSGIVFVCKLVYEEDTNGEIGIVKVGIW